MSPPDMQVGATNIGAVNLDQDIVRPDLRKGIFTEFHVSHGSGIDGNFSLHGFLLDSPGSGYCFLYLFSFLKFKYYFRQDLQDYFDFCAFPEERHKPNHLTDRVISFLWKRIEVAQGLPEPEQKPVNPVNPV
jgi:hypothetical protein